MSKYLLFSLLLLMQAQALIAQPEIYVEGLFKGGAILRIDGQQQMLRQGQTSVQGVSVLEASTDYVLLEVAGRQQKLSLSRHVAGASEKNTVPEVSIARDSHNRYLSYASINGKRTTVLVDTGANIVAMSGAAAKRLGIAYRQGAKSNVVTASGVTPSYSLILNSVSVGGISVSGVAASVIEGDFPTEVLLGMSYLSQVEMSEKNGLMTLRRKY